MAATPRGVRTARARAAAAEVDVDLDAVREATIKTGSTRVRLAGRVYVLAPVQTLGSEALELIDSGKKSDVIEAIILALPEADREAFRDARPGIDQLEALAQSWLSKAGLKLGESEASPENYSNTARP